jgi:hypothetical protein
MENLDCNRTIQPAPSTISRVCESHIKSKEKQAWKYNQYCTLMQELEFHLYIKIRMCHFLMIFLWHGEKRDEPVLIHSKKSFFFARNHSKKSYTKGTKLLGQSTNINFPKKVQVNQLIV